MPGKSLENRDKVWKNGKNIFLKLQQVSVLQVKFFSCWSNHIQSRL